MRTALGRCRSGRTGRIRNPLCQQWHLGFKSLSSRHIQSHKPLKFLEFRGLMLSRAEKLSTECRVSSALRLLALLGGWTDFASPAPKEGPSRASEALRLSGGDHLNVDHGIQKDLEFIALNALNPRLRIQEQLSLNRPLRRRHHSPNNLGWHSVVQLLFLPLIPDPADNPLAEQFHGLRYPWTNINKADSHNSPFSAAFR